MAPHLAAERCGERVEFSLDKIGDASMAVRVRVKTIGLRVSEIENSVAVVLGNETRLAEKIDDRNRPYLSGALKHIDIFVNIKSELIGE